ncbi:MAG: hypothetical protein AAF559_02005 [Pseudomonadota bacterium]
MSRTSHPILNFALLAAITLRMIVGAPCCMEPVSAASHSLDAAAHSHHAHHGHHAGDEAHQSDTHASSHGGYEGGHEGHGGDNTANPCCSACGPTLPADPVQFAASSAPKSVPEPTPVRALATRPPFPAYDARGPPNAV